WRAGPGLPPCPPRPHSYRIDPGCGWTSAPGPPTTLRRRSPARQPSEETTMTYLFNDPADFATEAGAGLALSHPHHGATDHGGARRATQTPPGPPAPVRGSRPRPYPRRAARV